MEIREAIDLIKFSGEWLLKQPKPSESAIEAAKSVIIRSMMPKFRLFKWFLLRDTIFSRLFEAHKFGFYLSRVRI